LRAVGILARVTHARMDRKTRRHTLCVEIDTLDGLTFAMLDEISNVFLTKKINVGARHYQGCDTCGGETCVVLEILDAVVPAAVHAA
jgi:hypothetical protein